MEATKTFQMRILEGLGQLLAGYPARSLVLTPLAGLYGRLASSFALFSRFAELFPVFKEVRLFCCRETNWLIIPHE